MPDARAGSSDSSGSDGHRRRTRSKSVEWRCLACWTSGPHPPIVVFPSRASLFAHVEEKHADLQALWKAHGMIEYEYCSGCRPHRKIVILYIY